MLECPKCNFIPPNPNVLYCPNCNARRVIEGSAPSKRPSAGPAGKRRKWLGWIGCAAVLLIIYIGTYIVLTLGGGMLLEESGAVRDRGGSPKQDVAQWQPRGLHLNRYREMDGEINIRANVGGWIFMPLIIEDRRSWHHTEFKIIPPPKR